MNCDSVLERITAGDRLTGRPTPEIDAHLAVCPDCRMRAGAAEALGRRLRDPLLWEEPPGLLAERVVDAVSGNLAPRPSRPRWWIPVAAAMVAFVVAIGWLNSRPDWSIELMAGPEAPGATAVVAGWNTGEGTRMVFDVKGLEDAPAGSYYEVWLTAPDGRHVSAGTFRSPGRFEVMAGVARRDFPRIWVTWEPADSEPGPYEVTVLDSDGV